MKFKNITGKPVRVRYIKPNQECLWKTIKPDEVIDLPEEYGFNLGLEPYKEELEKPKPEPKETKPKKHKLSLKELMKIKGIGEKTAKDIITAYPCKEDLVEAIKQNKELPFRDDVVKKLIKRYS